MHTRHWSVWGYIFRIRLCRSRKSPCYSKPLLTLSRCLGALVLTVRTRWLASRSSRLEMWLWMRWGDAWKSKDVHQGKPECLFLLFDTNFTEKLAKIWFFHKIFTFQQFHPMITWPDNSTKCCIILLNYARYSKRIGKFTSGHCKFYCHGRVGTLIFILSYLRTCDPGRILLYIDRGMFVFSLVRRP